MCTLPKFISIYKLSDYEIMFEWIYMNEHETSWTKEIFEAQKFHIIMIKKLLLAHARTYMHTYINSAAHVHVCILMLDIAHWIVGTRHAVDSLIWTTMNYMGGICMPVQRNHPNDIIKYIVDAVTTKYDREREWRRRNSQHD